MLFVAIKKTKPFAKKISATVGRSGSFRWVELAESALLDFNNLISISLPQVPSKGGVKDPPFADLEDSFVKRKVFVHASLAMELPDVLFSANGICPGPWRFRCGRQNQWYPILGLVT